MTDPIPPHLPHDWPASPPESLLLDWYDGVLDEIVRCPRCERWLRVSLLGRLADDCRLMVTYSLNDDEVGQLERILHLRGLAPTSATGYSHKELQLTTALMAAMSARVQKSAILLANCDASHRLLRAGRLRGSVVSNRLLSAGVEARLYPDLRSQRALNALLRRLGRPGKVYELSGRVECDWQATESMP